VEIDEVKTLITERVDEVYKNLRTEQRRDEEFYELKFGKSIPLPKNMRVSLPNSARELVDIPLSHLLSGKVIATQPARRVGEEYEKMSMRVDGWLAGWIDMLLKESPSPLVMGMCYMLLRGEVVWKVVYDEDRWKSKDKLNNFPIRLIAVDPVKAFPHPTKGGRVIPINMVEHYKRTVGDIRETWGDLDALKSMRADAEVDWDEFWSDTQRCFLANGESIWEGGMQKNHYSFTPYVHFYAGLGQSSIDGDIETLARSIIYPYRDLLIIQARLLSQIESIIDLFAWPGVVKYGTFEVDHEIDFSQPGWEVRVSLPRAQAEIEFIRGLAPPQEVFALYGLVTSIIQGGGLQPAMRGEVAGRSGLQLEAAIGEGRRRWERTARNYENSLAVALGLGLRLIDTVIKEPVGIKTMEIKDGGKAVAGEVALKPTDINNYYVVDVSLEPEDEVETARRKALGADMQGRGVISWKGNLIRYHKMTPAQADEEIQRSLAEKFVMSSPEIASAMGFAAAEELGMLRELEGAEMAAEREKSEGKRLEKRGAPPIKQGPAYPAPGPAPYDMAASEIEQGLKNA